MLSQDRHTAILHRLKLRGTVRTVDLSNELGVTEETIRKDLVSLSDEGRIIRVHGGARLSMPSHFDLPLPERESLNRPEKTAIALAASKLLEPRDSLFLDASSTVLTFAQLLPQMPLTIVTNANQVILALGERADVQILSTGGSYEPQSRSFVGIHAEDSLMRYHVRWMFIGANGLDTERGASEINPRQAALKKRLLPMAERICLLADHTKLEQRSAYFFAAIEDIDMLITDEKADPDLWAPMEERGVQVIVARTVRGGG